MSSKDNKTLILTKKDVDNLLTEEDRKNIERMKDELYMYGTIDGKVDASLSPREGLEGLLAYPWKRKDDLTPGINKRGS